MKSLLFALLAVVGISSVSEAGWDYISASPQNVYVRPNQLGRTYLNWNVSYPGWGAVVTVESKKERIEKVFACHIGSAQAPWIQANDDYIFRVYNTGDCFQGVQYYNRPVARIVVRGLPY